MEFGDLFSEHRGTYTKESLKAYKSLEAYNYFFNGYVRTIYYYDVGSTSDCERSTQFCILKALVNPSQRAMPKAKRGMGHYQSNKWHCGNCTLYLHGWVQPAMINDVGFVKPSYEKDAKQDQASAMQSAIPRRIKKHQIPLLSPSSTLLSLHKVVPDACVFTTIPLPSFNGEHVPNSSPNLATTESSQPTCSTVVGEAADPSKISEDHLLSAEHSTPLMSQLPETPIELFHSMEFTEDQSYEEMAQEVFFRMKVDASALVLRLLKPNDVSTLPAIKWGVANESTARDAYAQQMSHTHS
ncbi:hypothetical protein EMCRGX_G007377 [Ephydatia muelleri]